MRHAVRPPAITALIIAVLVLAGVVATPAAAVVGDCTPGAAWGSPRQDLAARVVQLVNQHRAGVGLGPLATSPTLTAAAQWKSGHMASLGYVAHEDPAPPVARDVGERLEACGYPTAGFGENVAGGQSSAESVVAAWLASSGHRVNIERPSYVAIGVGAVASSSGALYWTQDFGTVADAGSTLALSAPAPTPVAAGASVQQPGVPAPAAASGGGAPGASCRVGRARGARRSVLCALTIDGLATPASLRARLVRGSRTYARGTKVLRKPGGGTLHVRLSAKRRIRAGSYTLSVLVRCATAPPKTERRPAAVG